MTIHYTVDYLSEKNNDLLAEIDGAYTTRYVYTTDELRVSAEFIYAEGTEWGKASAAREYGENPASDFSAQGGYSMLYIALRVIVCLLILLISILGILKSKIHKKKLWIFLAVAVSFIIASASYLVPIENLFITFDTPEDAYFYTHPNEEVSDVIEGENSSMLVCENTYGFISNTEMAIKSLALYKQNL